MSNHSSLTERQQFWLEHLRSCAARGQSLSVYASDQGLSVSAFQQAKSRLRQRGIWPATGPHFVRVEAVVSTAAAVPGLYRVSLPNGVVVESASGDLSAVLLAAARLP